MSKLWLDCESIGLCGPVKLIQYAIDDGPVQFIPLFRGWEANSKTLDALLVLRRIVEAPSTLFIGFNAAFDLFKLYQTFHRKAGHEYDSKDRPIAPFACKVLDLQTHAMRHSILSPFAYSKGASRSIAAVRRIPRVASEIVGERVERVLRPLIPAVCQLKRSEHEVAKQPNLVSLSWSVDGRLSLKNLMISYGLPTLKLAEVWPLPEKGTEKPWLPYPDPLIHDPLEAVCDTILSDRSLPFWTYAALDIEFLRVLYEKLGRPGPDHHDTCTHVVAYTRYYGFPLDRPTLERTREAYTWRVTEAQKALEGTDLASPKQRLALVRKFDPLIASTKKAVIQVLADSDRPSAPIARAMLDFGMYTQRLNQVEKVLESRTGRAHPDFRVMGTRTGRMAGTAGLNWQGIPQAKKGLGIRAAMGTAAGGDWSSFEVCISAAVFPDAAIQEDLDLGIDPHSMNASLMQPAVVAKNMDYAAFKALVDAHDPWASSIRKRTKAITFGLSYFCSASKVSEVLGVSMERAEELLARYYERYSGFRAYRARIERETETADTEHWSRESVSRMAREVTDMTGFRMRWDFEAAVANALWMLGGTGIRTGLDGTVLRNKDKGIQSIDGAVKSALLGGAISIQSAVSRQRGNAAVQATGANLTKILMANIWDRIRCPMICVHDEIQFAPHPNFVHPHVQACIEELVGVWKPRIKSLFFDYKETRVWADK